MRSSRWPWPRWPATVTVPDGQLSATFTFMNQLSSGTIVITSTFAPGPASTSTLTVSAAPTHLVISQIYGGGGNGGAQFRNDFIEIFNPTGASISLAGLSVQYASSTNSAWTGITPLPDTLSVPAGGYVLVQEGGNGASTVGALLPSPDVVPTGTAVIAMSATTGKVALVIGVTALTGCPTTNVIDLVGYGMSTMPCSEMTNAGGLTNTTAALRAGSGCVDTDNNNGDFVSTGPPAPRNAATPVHVCP
jgi:hypothetical protein